MASPTKQPVPESRVSFLKSVLPTSQHSIIDQISQKQQCTYLIQPAGRCAEGLACQRPARLSDDQPLIVKPLLNHIAVKSLRDVALNFNDEVLAALVVASARPQSPKETASDRRRSSNFCDSHTTGVRYLSGS